jgi:hypothetical protein
MQEASAPICNSYEQAYARQLNSYTGGAQSHQSPLQARGSIQVNAMDIRKNKALWIVGQILLVSLGLAVMAGGWMVIGTG